MRVLLRGIAVVFLLAAALFGLAGPIHVHAADAKFPLPIERVADIMGPMPGVAAIKAGNSIVFQGMTSDPMFKVRLWRLQQSFSNIVDMTGVTPEGMEKFQSVQSEWKAAIVDALNTTFDPEKALALAQEIDVRLEGGRLVISGEVNNPDDLVTIERVARMYDDNPVINATARKQMIELNVIFLGLKGDAGFSAGTRGLQNFRIAVPNYRANAATTPNGRPWGEFGVDSANTDDFGVTANNSLSVSLGVAEKDITTLVRPHLTTLNGQPAVFHSGGQIAFEIFSQNIADVVYKDYGTKLTATPMLTSDGQIEVSVELEFLLPQGTRPATNAGRNNLDFIRYSHSGRAVLGRGQAMVLSGMMSQMRQYDVSRTPGLSRIPILNFFFGQKNRVAENQEMVVIIQPVLPDVLPEGDVPPFRDGRDATDRSGTLINEMVYEERPADHASESIGEPNEPRRRKPFWRR